MQRSIKYTFISKKDYMIFSFININDKNKTCNYEISRSEK